MSNRHTCPWYLSTHSSREQGAHPARHTWGARASAHGRDLQQGRADGRRPAARLPGLRGPRLARQAGRLFASGHVVLHGRCGVGQARQPGRPRRPRRRAPARHHTCLPQLCAAPGRCSGPPHHRPHMYKVQDGEAAVRCGHIVPHTGHDVWWVCAPPARAGTVQPAPTRAELWGGAGLLVLWPRTWPHVSQSVALCELPSPPLLLARVAREGAGCRTNRGGAGLAVGPPRRGHRGAPRSASNPPALAPPAAQPP